MAKKIQKSEIAEDDIFGLIRKSADETIVILDKLSASLNETAEAVKKSIGGAKFDSTKAIDNFVKSTQKANKISVEAKKIEQQRMKVIAERNKAMQQQQKRMQEVEKTKQQALRTEQQELRNKEQLRKANERQNKAIQDQNSAYKQLVIKTREQKRESQELAARLLKLEQTGKKNSAEWRKTATAYREVTAAAKKGDKALKKIDSTVGDNFRNIGNYKSALKGLGSTLLALGGGMSLVSGIRNVAGIVTKFDQAQGDLLAISGKTKEELAGLTEQAKELGATTQFSATQITEMQIELAKLGFTSEQITQSTKAVANFAAATGAAIPEAAALAGSALRAFRLDATEMERVVSTLGVATTKSALDFSALNNGLSTIAPVAAAFGFSIEDTTALLGQLANAGFDASTSATATRNILLNLADANGDLAKELGRPIRSADDLAGALKELDERGIDLAESLELTDKRSVAAFQTFIGGADTLVDLRDSITDVNDELEAMAEKRLDTISGQFTLLESAWEGFVLAANEGSGIGETIKNVIGFMAKNLDVLLSTLGRLIVAWGTYKAALLVVKAVTWATTGGFKTMLASMMSSIKGLNIFSKATKGAATQLTLMQRTMNAIPFLAIVGMIIQMVNAMIDLGNATAYAKNQQKLLDDAKEQSAAFTGKLLEEERKAYDERLRQLDNELRLRKANGESAKKIDEERVKREKEIADESTKNIQKTIDLERDKLAEILVFNDKLRESKGNLAGASQEEMKLYNKLKEAAKEAGVAFRFGDDASIRESNFKKLQQFSETYSATLQNNIVALASERKEYEKYVEDREIARAELLASQKQENLERSKVTGALKDHVTEMKSEVDLAERLVELANERLKVEEDLRKVLSERGVKAQEKDIEAEFQAQKTLVENTGYMETDALDELIRVKGEMLKEARKKETDFEISSLNNEFAQKYAKLRENLESERMVRLNAQKKTLDENLKIAKDDVAKQQEARDKYTQALLDVETNYQNELANIKQSELAESQIISDKIVLAKEQEKNDLLDIQTEIGQETVAANDELIALQESYWQTQNTNAKTGAQSVTDMEKQMWKERVEIAQFATDLLIMQSDKRIAQLEKEIQAAEKQSDFLRQLAANGNIDAKESLAEQQRIADEAARKKAIAERKKQQLEFANTAFQTYGAKVEAGSQNPLGETLRDLTVLQQAVAAFVPAFLEGTEDTGSNGRGVDGKGGFHAILHPNERVMTKEQNKKVGPLDNEALADIAWRYQNGKLISASSDESIGGAWESMAVLKQLKSLEDTIKNKPEHDLNVEHVVQGAMNIVRTTKTGRDVVYNRYKVKA